MKQFKRVKVIMLPTGESNLSRNRSYKDYSIGTEVGKPYLTYSKSFKYNKSVTDNSESPQHLYIISDDKIKEDDCFIGYKIEEDCDDNSFVVVTSQNKHQYRGSGTFGWVKKIIATTDTSLNYIKHDDSVPYPKGEQIILPQPSQQFIEKYVEEYNKGLLIKEILVEYEYYK